MILLDTGILIDYFRAKDKEGTWFYELSSQEDLSISSITEYEFRIGFKSQEDTFLQSLLTFIQSFLLILNLQKLSLKFISL